MTSSGLISRPAGLAVAVVAAVALAFAAWNVLSSGHDSGLAAGAPAILAQDSQPADAEDGESAAAADFDVSTLETTYDTFLSRDPFESVRPPEPVAAEDDGVTTGTGTGATDPINGGSGAANGGTGTANGGTTGGIGKDADGNLCRTGTEAVCGNNVVVLQSIFGGVANVEVDGVPYSVAPGGTFHGSYQLLRIRDECADFLYLNGDEAELFTLCVGGIVAK